MVSLFKAGLYSKWAKYSSSCDLAKAKQYWGYCLAEPVWYNNLQVLLYTNYEAKLNLILTFIEYRPVCSNIP